MRILDLCSGREGWSRYFKDNGHEVVTVDIEERFHPTYVTDITGWHAPGQYDVVLASPPCIDYSKAEKPWFKDIHPDNKLLLEVIRIIKEVNPKYWVIENVRGAVPYFKPILGKPVARFGSRYLWGDFPILWAPHIYGKWKLPPSPERSSLRAEIPRPLAKAMYHAIIFNESQSILESDTKER
jgi:hypothetical protein